MRWPILAHSVRRHGKVERAIDEFMATAEPPAATREMLSVMLRRLLCRGFHIALNTTANLIAVIRVCVDDFEVKRRLHSLLRFRRPCFLFQHDAPTPSGDSDGRE